MFEKFTERARKVMSLARQEAQRLCCEGIGPEHIFLGILQEGGGVASKALKNLNVDLKRVRQEIDKLIVPSTSATVTLGQLPFTPRSKRVIELSGEASSQLGQDVIGTEMLLLAVAMEGENIAAQVLSNFDLKVETIRDMVLEVLGADKDDREDGVRIQMMPKVKWQSLAPLCSMSVWLFGENPPVTQYSGTLILEGRKLLLTEKIQVQGIPADRMEAIAASIAKEYGAVAYLVESQG